ncbi:MAG: 4Fe-4S dicluster domain-containing protein [Syntrophobacterales bacterium]|jgi:ferredoxin|nr:4Fe-4S dicluster domain-containing protein [Syntrophobacterales bacterium]
MERLREKVRTLLAEGKVAGYLGYIVKEDHPLPHLFTQDNIAEVDRAIVAPDKARYPLDKLLQQLAERYPEGTFAIQARGCDERGLNELYKWGQLDPEKVVLVGVACTQKQADYCECPGPWASVVDYGEKCAPVLQSRRVERIDALAEGNAFQEWLAAFDRCIKCYGCRDVCPMCFCKECSLEHDDLMSTGHVPPDTIFQLVRAIHMAGRCIDCGLCEENCPADIPLRVLYKKANALVKDLFDYQVGAPGTGPSPWKVLGDEMTLETKPL